MKNRRINILVMPTDNCNMQCVYCFHQKKPHAGSADAMSLSVVEQIMKISLPYYDRVNYIWHGGEPLLMGADFFRSVREVQNSFLKVCKSKIRNSIQSNLTLLNEEYAASLLESGFSIGGSFDGINNDITRGNSDLIMRGREYLLKSNASCGLISVVSNLTIDTLIDSYKYFNARNINYAINPYIGDDAKLKCSEQQFTEKIIELFAYWAEDPQGRIHISYFDRIIDYIIRKKKTVCTYSSCLGNWLAIDYMGNISPCNRWFPKVYHYGNVFEYKCIDEAFGSEGFRKLLIKAIQRREKCKSCEIFDFCSGGCNYAAMMENGIENNGGMLCQSLKQVYRYIEKYIFELESNASHTTRSINPVFKKMLDRCPRKDSQVKCPQAAKTP